MGRNWRGRTAHC